MSHFALISLMFLSRRGSERVGEGEGGVSGDGGSLPFYFVVLFFLIHIRLLFHFIFHFVPEATNTSHSIVSPAISVLLETCTGINTAEQSEKKRNISPCNFFQVQVSCFCSTSKKLEGIWRCLVAPKMILTTLWIKKP